MHNEYYLIPPREFKLRDVIDIMGRGLKLRLDRGVEKRLGDLRGGILNLIKEGYEIYGYNTGFGDLKDTRISDRDLIRLQENLIRSHAVASGEPAPLDIIKLTLLFRAISLSRGYSGVRAELINYLIDLFNKDIHIYMPMDGSVGSSGDLNNLAFIGLFMIGEGRIVSGGEVIEYDYTGVKPFKLREGEGLSLINGVSYSLAMLTESYLRLLKVLDNMIFASALSYNALRGNIYALSEKIAEARPIYGQAIVAKMIRELLEGSTYTISSRRGRDQDAYSLRCIPQILGPIIDTMIYVKDVIEGEANSTSDNPIFDEGGEPYYGGNFHAMNLALASDYLKTCTPIIANLSERLIYRLLNRRLSRGLPPYMTMRPGLNTGLMLLHYLASSLTAEVRSLASPTSVNNIPTSSDQEDIVSMSIPSIMLLRRSIDLVELVTASHIYLSILGIEARGGGCIGSDKLDEFYRYCRRHADTSILEGDKPYYMDIHRLRDAIYPRRISDLSYPNLGDILD